MQAPAAIQVTIIAVAKNSFLSTKITKIEIQSKMTIIKRK